MSDIIVHNSPENKAQVSHIYFMAQLGLILYFTEVWITSSIHIERQFKICLLHPPTIPLLLHFSLSSGRMLKKGLQSE